jgi:hypothetical protein
MTSRQGGGITTLAGCGFGISRETTSLNLSALARNVKWNQAKVSPAEVITFFDKIEPTRGRSHTTAYLAMTKHASKTIQRRKMNFFQQL